MAAIYPPLGRVRITVDGTTASGITIPSGVNPTRCLITVETANVRFRDDGTAPTTLLGMIIQKDSQPFSYEGDLSAIKFISVSSSSIVEVALYGERTLVR